MIKAQLNLEILYIGSENMENERINLSKQIVLYYTCLSAYKRDKIKQILS